MHAWEAGAPGTGSIGRDADEAVLVLVQHTHAATTAQLEHRSPTSGSPSTAQRSTAQHAQRTWMSRSTVEVMPRYRPLTPWLRRICTAQSQLPL